MKKILVRKIFPYDPTFNGQRSRYGGYCLITRGVLDPGILEKETGLVLPAVGFPIFHPSTLRGRETALKIGQLLKTGQLEELSELNEVLFDLEAMMTEYEFEQSGSNLVRERFCELFQADKLLESRASIKKRLNRFLDRLRRLPEGRYLVISHSFFMKLLQIYLKDQDLFNKPEVIVKYFDSRKKTFEFGQGFEFEL